MATHAGNLKLLGGRLCLDFVNTADGHGGEQLLEFLHSYDDLLAWSRHVGVLDDERVGHLASIAARDVERAQTVFDRAIGLREALFRVVSTVVDSGAPAPDDLAILDAALRAVPPRMGIAWNAPRFSWTFRDDADALDQMLWPVVWSAADLLVSDDLARVKLCPSENCGWLFLDGSRNSSRRWCSMEGCGNRAKARRHYQRARGGEG